MLTCSFCVLLHVSVNASFCTCRFCLQALNTEILPLTFWWLLGKDIILWLLPHYLSTKVGLQNNTQNSLDLSVSGGWLFDWQLVNDAFSILLGKWSSGHSQLLWEGVGVGGNLWRLRRRQWWMVGQVRQRGAAWLSCWRRDGAEVRMKWYGRQVSVAGFSWRGPGDWWDVTSAVSCTDSDWRSDVMLFGRVWGHEGKCKEKQK